MAEPFIGEIRIFPYNFAPRGWAFCHGQSLSIAENTALFAIIGTIYGGDGRVNFTLPDLRGSAAMGWGDGRPYGIYSTLGTKTGASLITLDGAEMPAHTHQVLVDDVDATLDTPQSNTLAKGAKKGGRGKVVPFDAYSDTQVANQPLSPVGIGSEGQTQPHENRQPYSVSNYCIALIGLFPSRN